MYKAKKLNYDYNDLKPVLSGETVFIHYEKHYKGYLKKLNDLLIKANYDFDKNIENIVLNIDEFPIDMRGDILYNAGGVLNHELYFGNMNPVGSRRPIGALEEAINKKYGSFESFKEKFILEANKLVGSGYTFLVLDNNDELNIINLSNQDTPYSYEYKPIMALDLWEHAYYLDYQNKRSDYINNFFEIVSFDVINENYKKNIHS